MRTEVRLLVVLVLIVSFSAATLPWIAQAASETCPSCPAFGVQRPPAKKESPPFSLKRLDGGASSLSQYRGKPVLLFFWASWCEACKEDIVLLEKFAQGKENQIPVLTIVVDGERERKIRQIVEKYKVKLPVLMILKEGLIDTYEVRMVPMVVVVDPEGFVVGKIIGQRDWAKPEAGNAIRELLGLR